MISLATLLPIIMGPALLWVILLALIPHELPLQLQNQAITLLIAHPDDEVMFFGPTLNRLIKPRFNNTISIICMSSGDFEGIGDIRKNELLKSAEILGIPTSNVHVISHEKLQDSQQNHWDPQLINELVSEITIPDTIITFDAEGVSGHANHKALNQAGNLWIKDGHGTRIWTLTTVSTARKYLFSFDVLYSYLSATNPEAFILSSYGEYKRTKKAMTDGHVSQMKWFRYGWISLSRYMICNELNQLTH